MYSGIMIVWMIKNKSFILAKDKVNVNKYIKNIKNYKMRM